MTTNQPHLTNPAAIGRRTTLAFLIASMLFALLAPADTLAGQRGTESDPYRTELLDWSIAVTGPNYALVDVALEEYPHGWGERVYIANVDSLGFVEIAFFDDDDSPEDTIDLMLRDFSAASQSLQVLDTGIANDMHFAIARFQLHQGPSGYFYIEVAEDIDGNIDLAQSIYTLDAEFLPQLHIAQSEISMNGLSFLNDPVIDLEAIITEDTALLASTPEPVGTPQRGTYTFETNAAELVVDDPIEFDFPYTSSVLEVMYLKSAHGYGLAGFIHQGSDAPEEVLADIFIGAPTGEEAPAELYLESDSYSALGVYRIHTQGQVRIMVILVERVDDQLWSVQAVAATEIGFVDELYDYQRGVTFDGNPLLGEIEAGLIEDILKSNQS